MDHLRGFDWDDSYSDSDAPDYVSYDDDQDGMELPPMFGDERRMQVRAYNFWANLLGNRNFPSIEDFDPESVTDFRENSVLLDFTSGIENPALAYLGQALRHECMVDEDIAYLHEVPPRSLLSRITDHYLQIIANRAPIGFEAEFVNQRGATIMYRGILLPFSSDDDSIDFIYGVINWKEMATELLSDELHLQIAQAMDDMPADADGQARAVKLPAAFTPVDELPLDELDMLALDLAPYGVTAEEVADAAAGETMPGPVAAEPAAALQAGVFADFSHHADAHGEEEPGEDASLFDWLHAARLCADNVQEADARSRSTLYRAIARAYDFSLIAERYPEDYAELLADSGLAVQERAPMTPIVKLVFGVKYDKTRITEFATALGHAHRMDIPLGDFAAYLEAYEGGLKALVKEERALRRAGKAVAKAPARDPRERLRRAAARDLSEFAGEGDEFVLLVARRETDGQIVLVGAVEAEPAFTEKAIQKTLL